MLDKNTQGGSPEASALTPYDIGYLAAIIDGEGSIGIYCRKKGNPNYFLKVAIFNTSHEVIEWLQTKVGGATVFHRYKSVKHRPVWVWSVYQDRAASVLRVTRPHMVIKTQQADLAIDFIQKFQSGRTHGVTPEQIELRQQFAEKMSLLNRPHLSVRSRND